MEFIQGEKFVKLSNENNIFYRHTHEVNNFLNNINITTPFILVSHNSDGFVGLPEREDAADINLIPNNLVKWYAQNVNVKHHKLESIPIGLENSMWFPELKKIKKLKNKLQEKKHIKNLVYVNHNITTHKKRGLIYRHLNNNKWATLDYGRNGTNYDHYINSIYNHRFVVCPAGHGIDTHRTWETLYLNTIPIEKRNINNSFYEDLPICFVDEWEEITEDFLNNEYIRIINTKYNLEKLDFNYWKNKIRNTLNDK